MSLNKIRWQCLRGTQELDCILQNYLDHGFESAEMSEREAFLKLLQCQDSDLQDWLLGQVEPEEQALREIVLKIRSLT